MRNKIIIFILISILSPWFWLLFLNPTNPLSREAEKFTLSTDYYLTQINTYRGEISAVGLGFVGKIVINKFTWTIKEGITRMLESFDPHYLFIEGDLNNTRSTGKNGLVFFWLVIPLAWYLTVVSKNKRLMWIFILFSSTIASIFFMEHYYSPAKIPMFIIFNWISACGLYEVIAKRHFLVYLYLTILLFEVTKFIHQYFLHYLI